MRELKLILGELRNLQLVPLASSVLRFARSLPKTAPRTITSISKMAITTMTAIMIGLLINLPLSFFLKPTSSNWSGALVSSIILDKLHTPWRATKQLTVTSAQCSELKICKFVLVSLISFFRNIMLLCSGNCEWKQYRGEAINRPTICRLLRIITLPS